MSTHWTICIEEGDKGFSKNDWIHLIASHPNLSPVETQFRPNPFKPGENMEIHAPNTSARVFDGESQVGFIHWAEDESISLQLAPNDGEEERMVAVVGPIAEKLNATIVGLKH